MENKQWAVYEDGTVVSGPFFHEQDAEQIMGDLFREEWSVNHEYYIDVYPAND